MSRSLKVLIVILVILVLGLAGLVSYPFLKDYFKKIITQPTTTPSTTTTTPTTPATSTITPVSDPGVTWLSEPEQLGDLGLFKSNDELNKDYITISEKKYYKIATLDSGGELILAKVQFDAPSGPNFFRFKKNVPSENNKYEYSYLAKHSAYQDYSEVQKFVSDKVYIDTKTTYQSLSAPNYLKVETTTLRISTSFGDKFFSELKNPKEVGETEYGKVYQTYVDDEPKTVAGRNLNLKLADSSIENYTVKFGFFTDDEVALVTWSNGTENKAKYTSEGYTKCGFTGSDNIVVDKTNIESRLIEAGKTNSGDKIYTVAATDAVMKAAYENYKIGRTKDILSIEAFAAKKPIFIWKDGFGDYVIFTGRDYAGLAECGKPVIYLYPEKTTKVSVKVGADISKSDPEYNGGWEAIAEPSGRLTVAGKIYDYLFWEGQGQEYPNINKGKVVEVKGVETVLREDLAQLGLNQKETADFLDFWLPKMPNTPYIRLTWFGTSEMNKLAPLAVSPKPDTTIRIFLDFEGLDKPYDLKPQNLSAPARKGFTLVEWGGLLREEIR